MEHILNKATPWRLGERADCLIHRNKHRESGKMKRQKNTFQMKEQYKNSEKDLNETEINNLPALDLKSNDHKDAHQNQKNQLKQWELQQRDK